MLKIDTRYLQKAQQVSSLEELFPLLQNAIELEHATIPPYLTAKFSLKPGTNLEVSQIIDSVVIEEMMHMTIAANILNALGGTPCINNADFVPNYPGPLPMGIGHDQGLIVGLEKYSKDCVKNVFMEIEEPENPLEIPVKSLAFVEEEYGTIGQFYDAIKKKIIELAPEALPGDPARQVTSPFFDPALLFPIKTRRNAVDAINIIVEQGEGTTTSPLDLEGEIAHYYRFQELYYGKRLVADPTEKVGYSFSGEAIPYDERDVYPLYPNTKTAMLAEGTEERKRMDEFNSSYASLLDGLHRTFNGEPGYLNNTIGVMFDIKLRAEKLCGTPFPGQSGYTIGPSFEYPVAAQVPI
jgi:rubrerythrin